MNRTIPRCPLCSCKADEVADPPASQPYLKGCYQCRGCRNIFSFAPGAPADPGKPTRNFAETLALFEVDPPGHGD